MIQTLLLLSASFSVPVLKVRVDGDGYLRFIRDGRAVYAKEAALQVSNGKLADSAGDRVLPSIEIGSNATDFAIDLQGNVSVSYGAQKVKAGQLVLAQFPSSEAFQTQGVVLIADDKPHLGSPGDDTFGVIRAIPGFDVPDQKITIKPVVEALSAQAGSGGPYVIPDSMAIKLSSTKPAQKQGASGSQVVQITVQQHSVMPGDHILLGQVAQIDGPPSLTTALQNVDLGDTPAIGAKRIIDKARIQMRLKMAGIKADGFEILVPPEADVRRKGQTIPNSDFVLASIKALIAQNAASGTWESTDSFSDLEVPSGKLELKVEGITGAESGDANVIVAIYIDGTRFNSRTVHLKLKDNVPPVQVGAAVKVLISAGRAEVEVPGVARTGGRLGQSVQVEVQIGSPPVKTIHTGIVTGPATVEVRL